VKSELLFAGTEFGAWFSLDAGQKWTKFSGLPTIAVRDLEIQKRENDLVFGTFGRSIYILDDYSPLRQITPAITNQPATLFPVKDALRYVERSRLGGREGRGSQGASLYAADNPPFGAVFTYYLQEKLKTRKETRQAAENKDREAKKPIRQPSFEELQAEQREKEPQVLLVVCDADNRIVRRVGGSRDAGLHRVAWDLRYPSTEPVSLKPKSTEEQDEDDTPSGPLALPGKYTVALIKEAAGEITELSGKVSFQVVPLELATMAAKDKSAVLQFQQKVARLQRAVEGAVKLASETESRLQLVREALRRTPDADPKLFVEAEQLQKRLTAILIELRGDPTRDKHEIPAPPTIQGRVQTIISGQFRVTAPPTKTELEGYRYAGDAFKKVLSDLRELVEGDLRKLDARLEKINAPWTPGRVPEWKME
jgi:hypothetical protein